MWKPITSWVWLAAVVAASVVAACSGDEAAPVSQPQPQVTESAAQEDAQQQSASPSASQTEDSESTAASVEQEAGEEEREDSPEEEEAQKAESRQTEAAAQSTTEQSEEEQEEPAEGLTDVPGVVLVDADVRVRPGLAWPTVDRLTAGEPVLVLNGGGGWFRISYGDEIEGWIRSTAVDLREIDEWSVLRQTAPAILAEWRGVEYGVMGQSADGAEVRLLAGDDEQSDILGAPKDEVTLLASDIAFDDLPILIGDETVVFPGDDFRVGRGKILPKSDQWMWLDDGSLLAHNDTHVWQWRPDTDELEFTPRPPGYAKLSPDGRYLAIANLCPRDLDCSRDNDVVFIPLDGSPRITFSEELRDFEVAPTLGIRSNRWVSNLEWSGNSKAVKLRVALFDRGREPNTYTTLLFHIEGRMVRLETFWSRELQGNRCHVEIPFPGSAYFGGWEFHDHDTIASIADCVDADGDRDFRAAVFTLKGEFIRLDPGLPELITDDDDAQLRSAAGGEAVGERIHVKWSPSRQHGIVIEHPLVRTWLYRARQHDLRAISVRSKQSATESETWPTVDPAEDLQGWACCRVYWFNDERAMVFALWDVYTYGYIHSAIVLDLSTGEGVELDLAGNTQISLQPQGGWHPRGESFQILVGGTRLTEPLVEGLNMYRLLFFRHDGGLRSALLTASGCRLLDSSGHIPRHGADWSPDGMLFAIGGQEPGGLYYCSSGE